MGIIIHLLAMEFAAVAVVLSYVWRDHQSKRFRVILAACVPILYLIAAVAAIPLLPSLKSTPRMPTSLFIGVSVIFWLLWFRLSILRTLSFPSSRSGLGRWVNEGVVSKIWLYGGLFVQFISFHVSGFILAWWFIAHDPLHPLSCFNLSILIGLAELSSTLLIGATIYGMLAEEKAPDGGDASEQETINFFTAIQWLQSAILFRGFALASSLALGAYYNPMGTRFFFDRLFQVSLTLVVIRIILGLILPTLFAWVAVAAMRHHERQQAIGQFVPTFIVVLFAEILATGLTLGMFGIAF